MSEEPEVYEAETPDDNALTEVVSELRDWKNKVADIEQQYSCIPIKLTLSDAPDSAIRLFAYLDWRAGKKREAFPSIRRIAKEIHQGTATVQRAIFWLESNGFLVKIAGGFTRSNRYSLPIVYPKQIHGVSNLDTGGVSTMDTMGVSKTDTEPSKSLEPLLSKPKKLRRARTEKKPAPEGWKECTKAYSDGYFERFKIRPSVNGIAGDLLKERLKSYGAKPVAAVIRYVVSGKEELFKDKGVALQSILAEALFLQVLGKLSLKQQEREANA